MKSKNNQFKVKTNKDSPQKKAKRANQLNMKEKKIERHNGSDPKSLKR
jgi:hypothetical protein